MLQASDEDPDNDDDVDEDDVDEDDGGDGDEENDDDVPTGALYGYVDGDDDVPNPSGSGVDYVDYKKYVKELAEGKSELAMLRAANDFEAPLPAQTADPLPALAFTGAVRERVPLPNTTPLVSTRSSSIVDVPGNRHFRAPAQPVARDAAAAAAGSGAVASRGAAAACAVSVTAASASVSTDASEAGDDKEVCISSSASSLCLLH